MEDCGGHKNMLLVVPAWKWTRKEKLSRASLDPVSEVVREWGGWNQQGLPCGHGEGHGRLHGDCESLCRPGLGKYPV